MNNPFSRGGTPQWAGSATHTPRTARSAALLIDFDNVTLGVHSDLGRELKNLINSEVFRGKIAVRRAYADWRRFPNYVVPLTEASIDLIFAPAYGSSKKNTTDLRMSADAIELAFTRPEMDTFILLTGDSDFSSTVMKLKEYGKYVIGVGMRESSSDLIIQNCDEYFSFHALTGLTRAKAGEGTREDPWELVVRAAQKMASTGDAMRTDRLKQVMLSLDPGFNEKELGYSKFSRFVSEADKKGLLQLNKLPDGQYEIAVDGIGTVVAGGPSTETREAREPRRDRDSRRGRGDRDRGRRREPVDPDSRPQPIVPAEPAAVAASEPAEPESAVEPTPVEVVERAPEPVAAAPAAEAGAAAASPEMQHALALLQRAVRALSPRDGAARDGDVKRRMLDMEPGYDEGNLGFSKFSRFLRAAHDAEAIDLSRLEGGQYEVKLGSRRIAAPAGSAAQSDAATPAATSAPAAEATATEEPAAPRTPAARRGRGRRGSQDAPPPLLPGQVVQAADEPAAAEVDTPRRAAAQSKAAADEPAAAAQAAEPTRPVRAMETPAASGAAEPTRLRSRRGRRGMPADGAPPAPLPGQVVGSPNADAPPASEPEAAEPTVAAEAAGPEAETAAQAEETARKRKRGGRGRKRGAEAGQAADAESAPEAPSFSAEALGLPTGREQIEEYLTRSYKGVGKKTAEPMLDAFGEDIFRVFAEEPDRVREVLGDKRATTVLDQWSADFERRREVSAPAAEAPQAAEAAASADEGADGNAEAVAGDESATRTRRRGGRGRKRGAETSAAAPPAEEAAAGADAAGGDAAGADAPSGEEGARPAKSRSRGGRGRNSRAKKDQPASS